MSFSLDKKSSKHHEKPKRVKEKILLFEEREHLNYKDEVKLHNQPYKLRKNVGNSTSEQLNHSRNQQQFHGTVRDDELVKYMSNLPSYLQRLEVEVNIQDKALNVGVLDWSRLEKWKPTTMSCDTEASSSTFPTTAHNKMLAQRSKQHSLPFSKKAGGIPSIPKIKKYEDSVARENQNEKITLKRGNFLGKSRPNGSSIRPTMEYESACDADQLSSSKFGNRGVYHLSKEKINAKMRAEEFTTDFASQPLPGESANIFFRFQERFHEKKRISFSGSLNDVSSRTSLSDAVSPSDSQSVICPQVQRLSDSSLASSCILKRSMIPLSEDFVGLSRSISDEMLSKGRNSSPNHRFGFSLSRMSRSFSLKESSALTQSKSTYDNPKKENNSTHNRTSSSPFRRILEPLLKPKVSNPFHLADQPQKQNSESIYSENCKASATQQASIQFSANNGLPMYRFKVNDSNHILAVKPKSSTSSGNYTFYSVSEIKKKRSSWIHQGGKGNGSDYAYNVIGHMKVQNTYAMDFATQNSDNHYKLREFVLFGVELKESDQKSSFVPNSELAAVVVKTSTENISLDVKLKNKPNITVVLPSGFHGQPHKGVPSPLIDRWKTGGSCDCGGWDIGCKLHILFNEPLTTKTCTLSNQLELFIQGGSQENNFTFTLTPAENGIHKAEFSSPISSLQACFISVAVISCNISFDGKEPIGQSYGVVPVDPARYSNDETKNPVRTVFCENHIKYTPNPPLSPVGRA